jgi:hypothetical protein
MNTCCSSAVSQQEEQKIQDVYVLEKAVAVVARVKTKVTGLAQLGSFGNFWALFGSFSFFGSFGPILAYFGLFYFFGFLWLFLALSGSFWLFFDTLQLFAAFSIGTVHCLPPGRIVLWMRSWQQESEVRLCKYEGPRENQCHNCWPRQIGSVQEDLREGLEYWE